MDEVVSIVKAVGDQTNLLGINAAIEAAHAGEMGEAIDRIAEIVDEQAEAARQISSFIQEIQQMSEKLNQYTQKL